MAKNSQASLRSFSHAAVTAAGASLDANATVSPVAEEKTSVLTIRVPHQLKERIEFAAEQQGVSINQFALYAFTKQLSELEDSAYYQQFIRNKTRQDLLAGFDATMNKVQYRIPAEDWDKLPRIAEPDTFAEFRANAQKTLRVAEPNKISEFGKDTRNSKRKK